MRAWAIWGTRKRVTKILISTYCIVQLGGAIWTLNRAHLCCSPLLLFVSIIRWNGYARTAYFRYLDLAKICVGVMPSKWWWSYLFPVLIDTASKVMRLVGSSILNELTRYLIADIEMLVAIFSRKVRILHCIFIALAENNEASFSIQFYLSWQCEVSRNTLGNSSVSTPLVSSIYSSEMVSVPWSVSPAIHYH